MITPDGIERNLEAMRGAANRFRGTFFDLAQLGVAWPLPVKAWLFLRALERAREWGQVSEADFYAERERLLMWRGE